MIRRAGCADWGGGMVIQAIGGIEAKAGPLQLSELSSIGFGCYRISTVRPHEEALMAALQLGCNLIDTAASYSGGRSEHAIGNVLGAWQGRSPFIVTKAGYCDPEDQPQAGLTITRDGIRHCIHPDFLRGKLRTSRDRLGRRPDAFLLHNPEYHFEGATADTSEAAFYLKLAEAFAFLEEQADAGVIRYYGVSSNGLGLSRSSPVVCFEKLVQTAHLVSASPRFKFIQFPFNFYESQAAAQGAGPSLLAVADERGIVTMGNRPLNAVSGGESRRIATYEWMVGSKEEEKGASVDALRALLVEALRGAVADEEITKIPAVQFLNHLWRGCKDPEFVEYVLVHYLNPLGDMLFRGESSKKFAQLRDAARVEMMTQALRRLTQEGRAIRDDLVASGRLAFDDTSLAVAACRQYLEQGIGHVLVGMRKRAYVEELCPLFFAARGGTDGSAAGHSSAAAGRHVEEDASSSRNGSARGGTP